MTSQAMKWVLIILGILLIPSFFIINVTYFYDSRNTVLLANVISRDINTTGRMRFEVVEFYASWLESEGSLKDEAINSFMQTAMFKAKPDATLSNSFLQEDSDYLEVLSLHQELTMLAAQFHENLEKLHWYSQEHGYWFKHWKLFVVQKIDERQSHMVLASESVINKMLNDQNAVLRVNIFMLTLGFVILLLVWRIKIKSDVLKQSQTNTLLEEQNRILNRSQVYLHSILEDLNIERQTIHRHEKKLKQLNNRLMKNNEELEAFIYTISHDLRSPLVTIGGFTERLKDSFKEVMDEKQCHRFNRIQSNVEHMETLLNNLLQLSKIMNKPLGKEPVDLAELIKEVMQIMEEELVQCQGDLQLIEPLVLLSGNRQMMGQCLQNLIANAIRYREEQRPLVIKVSTEAQDRGVVIKVEDNGIGIDSKYHQQVFKIFERLSSTGPGSGVGLAIVKAIMDKHDGWVSLSSEVDKGCSFSLYFPK